MIKKVSAVTVLKGIDFGEALLEIPNFAALADMLHVNVEGDHPSFEIAIANLLPEDHREGYHEYVETYSIDNQVQIKALLGASYGLLIHIQDPQEPLKIEFAGLLQDRRCLADHMETLKTFYFKLRQLASRQTQGSGSDSENALNKMMIQMKVCLASYLQQVPLSILMALDHALFKEVPDPQSTHSRNAIQKALDDSFGISGGQAADDPHLATDSTLKTIVRHLAAPGLSIERLIDGLELDQASLFDICKHIFHAAPTMNEEDVYLSTNTTFYQMGDAGNIVLTSAGKLALINALLGTERLPLAATDMTPLETVLLRVIQNPDTQISQAEYNAVFDTRLSSAIAPNACLNQIFGRMGLRASVIMAAHLDEDASALFQRNALPTLSESHQATYYLYKAVIGPDMSFTTIKRFGKAQVENIFLMLTQVTTPRFRPLITTCMNVLNKKEPFAEETELMQLLKVTTQNNPKRAEWIIRDYGTELVSVLNLNQVMEWIQLRNRRNRTVADYIARYHGPIFVALAAPNKLGANRVMDLMQLRNGQGNTVAHLLAEYQGPLYVELAAPDKLGPNRVMELMQLRNGGGSAVAHWIEKFHGRIFIILASPDKLGAHRVMELMQLRDNTGETVTHRIAEYYEHVLVALAAPDKLGSDRVMELMQLRNGQGYLAAHILAKYQGPVFVALAAPNKLGRDRVLTLLGLIDAEGHTVSEWLNEYHEHVLVTLAATDTMS